MKPYYQDKWVTILKGDCRQILPQLDVREYFPHLTENKVDLVLTDPPYPDQHPEYGFIDISFLDNYKCLQLIFWSAKIDFPLDYTAIHIWDKQVGCASEYERIFERNGQKNYKVFRVNMVNSTYSAMRSQDVFTGHKSQKPKQLIGRLLKYATNGGELVLDPFLGSGTLVATAPRYSCYSIGIEIEEKYCEIAAKRCSQEVMEFSKQ